MFIFFLIFNKIEGVVIFIEYMWIVMDLFIYFIVHLH